MGEAVARLERRIAQVDGPAISVSQQDIRHTLFAATGVVHDLQKRASTLRRWGRSMAFADTLDEMAEQAASKALEQVGAYERIG